MADLDVQPKRSRAWWPWLLLILLALAVLFFLTRGREPDRDTVTDPEEAATTDTTAAATSRPPLPLRAGIATILMYQQ
jgi:hypothetical protein